MPTLPVTPAPKFRNRIRDTSIVSGTGNVVVTGTPPQNYFTFSSRYSIGDILPYAIVSQTTNEWEVGLGTYSAVNQISRNVQVYDGTAGAGTLVNFSAGPTKDVYVPDPADLLALNYGHAAVGNYAAIDSATYAPGDTGGQSSVALYNFIPFLVNEYISGNLSSQSVAAGIVCYPGINNTTTAAASGAIGVDCQVSVDTQSIGGFSSVTGGNHQITNFGQGNITTIVGGNFSANHQGSGVVGNLTGAAAYVTTGFNFSGSTGNATTVTGFLATAYGIDMNPSNVYGAQIAFGAQKVHTSGAINVPNANGILINSATTIGGATINNVAGIQINDQSGVGGTTSLNLYSRGNASFNIFEGTVQIGTTSGNAFANLPSSPATGMVRRVTDAATTAWNAAISAGGGGSTVLVWYNGVAWHVIGA